MGLKQLKTVDECETSLGCELVSSDQRSPSSIQMDGATRPFQKRDHAQRSHGGKELGYGAAYEQLQAVLNYEQDNNAQAMG